MRTTIAKKEDVNQKWYLVDAKDKILGRIATTIANKLRGKDKPTFSPHMDCGDHVIVINADKIKLTGTKMDSKKYYTHSGYPGAIKEESAKRLIERKPTRLLELAVSGMLPKNKLRKVFMKKLKLYAGEEHQHSAQSPEVLEV
ncbi:MAG: 50S ribosomal protein L13 [Nitrospirae bacterium]|nr:50S ribosomal protein L13 [Nitrospirota bacterium]